MRRKDENKNQAIFDSTIQLINEIGFVDISMSKIAKRAGLSSSTIYVYYESKEDLLLKLYLSVKEKLSRSMVMNVHEDMDAKELCHMFMTNSLAFMIENKDWFLFLEQFSTSPLMNKLCLDEATSPMFEPLFRHFEKQIQDGKLKPMKAELLLSYCYQPLVQLAKAYHNQQLTDIDEEFKLYVQLSWDAIRS
ncbi:TetR/AcrR family transcriptional regulator [Paenibacillus aestuarii]|uniref:TetR/AcrR family transcriptional regulator n=1 Tax=Paenibacillus aestuarii TaxID=516965 RepID=A0ABW0K7Q5_9BACL|nr:TetR/AcrR family transcriptional regulator [Paenibacillus aestuarii]